MKIPPLRRATAAVLALVAVAAGATACSPRDPKDPLTDAHNGKLTIGVKYDQPGIGLRLPNGTLKGFDVSVAKYVAKKLGVSEGNIQWMEAPSAQRENLISNGQLDFIVASYSINSSRNKRVDFAGPYYIAGQSLLVRADETDITGPEDLNKGNKRLCSVTGSTSAQVVKTKFASDVQLQEYDSYSSCVEAMSNGVVDALTTDDIILAGFAAQYPGEYKVVGKPFSTENYGIGLAKGKDASRKAIAAAIQDMIDTGEWQKALDEALGDSGFTPGAPPTEKLQQFTETPDPKAVLQK